MTMNKYFLTMLLWLIAVQIYAAETYNIKAYGAIPDGKTINTLAIQKAIDQCAAKGGGKVTVPAGLFLTGTIMLRSQIELHLESGAVLIGSTNRQDYPLIAGERGLIFGIGQENVSITGFGEINGNGKAFFKGDNAPDRPFLLMFKHSRQINVSGITLKNSAFWTFRLLYSDGVIVNGIRIYAHVNFNNDGIDIDSKNVVISNCIIDTDDDALCFKSDSTFICENVSVSNCVLASNCNLIKMGTASIGGFKNISINNCSLRKAAESNFRFWNKNVAGVTDSITGLAGIALEIVDGGQMDQVNINNITMEGVQTPIFIRLGSRRNATGSLKNVSISNIIARTYSKIPSSITAVPGFYIENLRIKDVLIQAMGSGTESDALVAVPEQEKEYPENRMFGPVLPAYGLFVRHVKHLFLDHVRFDLRAADARPAIDVEDCEDFNLSNFSAAKPVGKQALIRFKDVKNAFISGYASVQRIPVFLNLQGSRTENIFLSNNNFYQVEEICTKDNTIKDHVLKISL